MPLVQSEIEFVFDVSQFSVAVTQRERDKNLSRKLAILV